MKRAINFGIIFIFLILQSCVMHGNFRPSYAWHIDNTSNYPIVLLTAYVSDNNIIPSDYVDAIACINQDAIYSAEGENKWTSYNELKQHPNIRMFFVIPYEGIDYNDFSAMASKAVAYFDPTYEWMMEHYMAIRFPKDCTVNPELGEIYDLDEFVEQYGPLNAQGWDEVWQRWQQSKPTADAPR